MSKLTALAEYVPLATHPSQQKEVNNPELVEHSTIHGCTETQVKTECTIEL